MSDRRVTRALALIDHTARFCLAALGFWTWIWNGIQW